MSKENLLKLMLGGKISLSQIDYRFLSNVTKQIEDNKGITTNQSKLFDKLVQKYSRQLKKNQINAEEVITLPWLTHIVSSTEEYTGARVYVEGDTLAFKVPFNNKFIHHFNRNREAFSYQKDTKTYTAKFSTKALKYAVTKLPEFFDAVHYDQDIQSILNELKSYEGGFYNPTLVDMNGHLVVVACNSILGNIIKDIQLEKSAKCIDTLSELGVSTDASVIGSDPKLEFAGNKYGELTLDNIKQSVAWLEELGYTGYVIPRASVNMKITNQLVMELERSTLKSYNANRYENGHKLVVFPHTRSFNVGMYSRPAENNSVRKVLVLRDSTNIEVK